jgi:hypothetical protein
MRTDRLNINKLYNRVEKYCTQHAYITSMKVDLKPTCTWTEILISGMGFDLTFEVFDRYNLPPGVLLLKHRLM